MRREQLRGELELVVVRASEPIGSEMQRVTATIPDEIAAELQRRADAELRSAASLVRLAVRQLLFASDGATLGRGWKLEEDWAGVWASRDKPGHPATTHSCRRILSYFARR